MLSSKLLSSKALIRLSTAIELSFKNSLYILGFSFLTLSAFRIIGEVEAVSLVQPTASFNSEGGVNFLIIRFLQGFSRISLILSELSSSFNNHFELKAEYSSHPP
ncbi:hypothetical protein D3C81_628530 [compost metagenome]